MKLWNLFPPNFLLKNLIKMVFTLSMCQISYNFTKLNWFWCHNGWALTPNPPKRLNFNLPTEITVYYNTAYIYCTYNSLYYHNIKIFDVIIIISRSFSIIFFVNLLQLTLKFLVWCKCVFFLVGFGFFIRVFFVVRW